MVRGVRGATRDLVNDLDVEGMVLSLAPGGRLRPEHLLGQSHHQNLGHHPVFAFDSLIIHQVHLDHSRDRLQDSK